VEFIHLLAQFADFALRFLINTQIQFRPLSVFLLLSVLTHHDDGRLNGGQTTKNKVK
jgi:hypothetical protein